MLQVATHVRLLRVWLHNHVRFITSARASIWWSRMGLFPNSTSGLGRERVSGRNLVPKPPTRIRAFIFNRSECEAQHMCKCGCVGTWQDVIMISCAQRLAVQARNLTMGGSCNWGSIYLSAFSLTPVWFALAPLSGPRLGLHTVLFSL